MAATRSGGFSALGSILQLSAKAASSHHVPDLDGCGYFEACSIVDVQCTKSPRKEVEREGKKPLQAAFWSQDSVSTKCRAHSDHSTTWSVQIGSQICNL